MRIQRIFEIRPKSQTETHVPQFTDLLNRDSAAKIDPKRRDLDTCISRA